LSILDDSVGDEQAILKYEGRHLYLLNNDNTNPLHVDGLKLKEKQNKKLSHGSIINFTANTDSIVRTYILEPPILLGQALKNRYTLTQLLHQSEISHLYEAEDTSLNYRASSVRVFSHIQGVTDDLFNHFKKRASLISGLAISNIHPIIDYGSELLEIDEVQKKFYFIVMDYKKKYSWDDIVKKDKEVALSELVEWSLKLGKALDHCHEKKIYHGSIKPSAIIINDSNDPILLDFKIIHNSQFNATLIVGSPPYMSPQQWQGEDETAEDDQFSMAVVLYQLISGELPYKHNGKESPSNRLDNFRRGPSPCHDVAKKNGRHQVPAAVSAVLARALHEQPTGRYGSVNEFVNEFKKSIQIYDAVHKNRQKKIKNCIY